MSRMVYANFTLRPKPPSKLIIDGVLKDFCTIWNHEYEGYTDNAPSLEKNFANDGQYIYARADVGRDFDPAFLTPFMMANPDLQMEIIEEDYDSDRRCRYLLEGDVIERLLEVRYFEEPQIIDWPD